MNISLTISVTIPGRAALRARRCAVRSAVAVITGASAATLRGANTGATVRRCQRQASPSEVNRLSPTAGRSIRSMTSDFG